MMPWAWWLSALALAAVPVLHWLVLNRTFAVSGRISALVDRVRFPHEPEPELDTAAMLRALREQTAAAFGQDALDDLPSTPPPAAIGGRSDLLKHALFLGGVGAGGAVPMLLSGDWSLAPALRSETFPELAALLGMPAPLLLALGGVLVGFGTRMASGCTSGHGLCGVSQLQPGSLLSTGAFFAAGVGTSFALSALLGAAT